MNDKRSVYAHNLNMTEAESKAFWPVYDEYEARVKKLDDRFIALVNEFAEKYDTLTDKDAKSMLDEKMRSKQSEWRSSRNTPGRSNRCCRA